jgi:hypothetical protein
MSAAILAGMFGFVSVRRATVTAPDVTFADFPSPQMPLAAPRLDTQVAAERDQLARENHGLSDRLEHARREAEVNALTRKVTSGSASASEVQRFLELSKHLDAASDTSTAP